MPEPTAHSLPSARPPAIAWLSRDTARPAETQARDWLAEQLHVAGGDDVPLQRDPRGRPALSAPFDAFDASWSHSGNHLMVALAHGARVGVDVEWLRRGRRVQAIAERYFTKPEQAWLAAAGDPVMAFHRLWCAKEAVLKAHGHGLAFGLDRLGFTETVGGMLRLAEADRELGEPARWQLREWSPAPGYRAALAWRPRD